MSMLKSPNGYKQNDSRGRISKMNLPLVSDCRNDDKALSFSEVAPFCSPKKVCFTTHI